jgi:hypothetical protein
MAGMKLGGHEMNADVAFGTFSRAGERMGSFHFVLQQPNTGGYATPRLPRRRPRADRVRSDLGSRGRTPSPSSFLPGDAPQSGAAPQSAPGPGELVTTYAYDARHRLTRVDLPADGAAIRRGPGGRGRG